MKLLFTKGIKGCVDKSKIKLIAGNKVIETSYSYTDKDLINLENEYNIKLLGEIIKDNSLIQMTGDFNFMVSKNNKEIIYITSLLYKIDASFVEIYELIKKKIFINIDEYYKIISYVPIFITTEGLVTELFFSRKEFQQALVESDVLKLIDNETKNKIIYMNDLYAMIGDIQNYVLNVHNNLIEAQKELCKILDGVQEEFCIKWYGEEEKEYNLCGYNSQIISSMYMDVIVKLSSCLDIITKLFCEILDFPKVYDKPIRFKSGNIYFRNIKRFKEKFKNYRNYNQSILANFKDYDDIILSRNLIVHNSFFSSDPAVFWGFGTPVVNKKRIPYALMYIWDIDEDGKPDRWLNRCKFYGQNRPIDEYIINNLIKFYEQLDNTLEIIKEYLGKEDI